MGPVLSQYCAIREGGWLFGAHDERLFWLPPPFRTGLEHAGVPLIGQPHQCQQTVLDTSKFVHGEEWTRVREGGRIPDDLEERYVVLERDQS